MARVQERAEANIGQDRMGHGRILGGERGGRHFRAIVGAPAIARLIPREHLHGEAFEGKDGADTDRTGHGARGHAQGPRRASGKHLPEIANGHAQRAQGRVECGIP